MRKFQSMIIIRNERQFKAFTGLPENLFDRLLTPFTQRLESARQQRYETHRGQRHRRPGGGRKGTLSTPDLKLFFILFYLKTYPTFDVLGGLFDLGPAKAEENVIRLFPLLKQAEQRLRVLPHRHLKPISNNDQPTEKNRKSSSMPRRDPVADPTTPANKNTITVVKSTVIP